MPKENKPQKVVNRIIEELTKSKIETPTGISRKTGFDRRTVSKYLDLLEGIGVTTCTKILGQQREIRACSLTEDYKKFKPRK